jgi:hypothetical protein
MKFKEYAKTQFEDWKNTGKCSDAVRLNNLISPTSKYFDDTNPSFFYGDVNAPIVLVHLNPKREENYTPEKCSNFENFDDFWNYYSFFGKNKYVVNKSKNSYNKFDLKQIRFLKPFNILPFDEKDKYSNLETVIDKKLQIDLIPFGSVSFDYRKLGIENIQPFFDRLFELILSSNRKYIIFCGKVFTELQIPGEKRRKSHKFKLEKKDGSKTKIAYELINLEIEYKDQIIQFSIAPQYASRSVPLDKYGTKIAELYNVL